MTRRVGYAAVRGFRCTVAQTSSTNRGKTFWGGLRRGQHLKRSSDARCLVFVCECLSSLWADADGDGGIALGSDALSRVSTSSDVYTPRCRLSSGQGIQDTL